MISFDFNLRRAKPLAKWVMCPSTLGFMKLGWNDREGGRF
jgi:hypothetical protein